MANARGPIGKLIEALTDGLAEVIGQLAPRPDAIPVPIRDDRPRHPRR